MEHYRIAILWVRVGEPCPVDDCGIEPRFRLAEGKIEVLACTHYLRTEKFDGRPMLGFADDKELP